MTPQAAECAVRFAEALEAFARKLRSAADEFAAKMRAQYAVSRPLTSVEREEMAEHVASGGALCCKEGLKWLRGRVPEPWAQAINGWAYEALSCRPESDQFAKYADRVRGLKLDRFPVVY